MTQLKDQTEATDAGQSSSESAPRSSHCSIAQVRNFEEAFDSHVAGCLRVCECGTVFYDYHNSGYGWEEGELERLQNDPSARGLDYAVGTIRLDGAEYVMDCDCWKKKGERIIDWLTENANEVATFLNLEKKRKLQEASDLVPVD